MKHLFFIILLIFFVFSFRIDAQVEATGGMNFAKREVKESRKKNAGVEISAAYPELVGTGANVKEFNQMMKSLIMGKIAFAKEGLGSAKSNPGLDKEQIEFYAFQSYYTIEFANQDFIGIRFEFYDGVATFLHGRVGFIEDAGSVLNLNYDLKRQKEVKLGDLFQPGSKYLNVLSNNITAQRIEEGFDEEIARMGVEPEAGLFRQWNFSKRGIKLHFELETNDQVETKPERIVPFEKFPRALRSELFGVVQASINKGADLSFPCNAGHFDSEDLRVELRMGKIKGVKNLRAYFYEGDYDNPNGKLRRLKSFLVTDDEVLIAREYGDFACAWYQPKKGKETIGWIPRSKLNVLKTDKDPSINMWLGDWIQGKRSFFEIKRNKKEGYLIIIGDSTWTNSYGAIHIGNLDDKGEVVAPFRNEFVIEDEDESDIGCQIRAKMIGRFLIVVDNKRCGGLNVTFDGVYWKK